MSSPAIPRERPAQADRQGYWCRFDQLDALLRNSDFSTSPDRWQNAHDLLLKLLEAGQLPVDPAQLRPLLTPLFCRSAREQAVFARLFEQWLELVSAADGQTTAGEREQRFEPPVELPKEKSSLPVAIAVILALLLIFFVAAKLESIFRQPVKVVELEPPDKSPVEPPDKPPDKPPVEPPVELPDKPPVEPPVELPRLPDVIPPPGLADLKPQSIPPRRPLQKPSLDAEHSAYVAAGQWLLRLLPGLLGLTWLAILWRRWQTVLERRRSERQQSDPLHAITLAAEADELLDSSPLRTALRRLHTPVAYPTRRLHLDATVQATARNAGLLHPVFAERMGVPECVVLVDYRHDADQMAAVAQLVIRRLEAAGLSLHRFIYQQDPGRVREQGIAGSGRWIALAEVASRYPDARLLLIGEPAPLIDRWNQKLRPWAEVLSRWPQRGLITTRQPPTEWLRIFQQQGLAVADLSSHGLESMARHLAGLPPQDQAQAPKILLPRELQNAEAWSGPLSPPEPERRALVQLLQKFLGDDGLLLLSAMAAYPELHWGLTRALDLNLSPDSAARDRELRLLRIARLPWCRDGGLPDWLRETLLDQCQPQQQKTIASLYQRLMGLADIDGKGEISLPFDLSATRGQKKLLSRLRRLVQITRDDSALQDRIFANALLGNRLRAVDFLLPRNLARRLPAGRMRLLLPRFLLVLLLAAAAGWGADQAWQRWWSTPAVDLAQKIQLLEHGRYRVRIDYTAETLPLARALGETLQGFGFEQRSLYELAETADAGNNLVVVGTRQDARAATLVAQRLAYLSWGLEPRVIVQAEDPAAFAELRLEPVEQGVLVIRLFASGRTGSRFSDPLARPLSEAQLLRWRTPPPPVTEEPVTLEEALPESAMEKPEAEQPPASAAGQPGASKQPQPSTIPSTKLPSESVRHIQSLLNQLGYGPLTEDGLIGPATRGAISRFRTASGLTLDDPPDMELLSLFQAALRQNREQESSLRVAEQQAAVGGGAQSATVAAADQAQELESPPQQEQGPATQDGARESAIEKSSRQAASAAPKIQGKQLKSLWDRFSDGSLAPEMLVVPAGSFRMGSTQYPHEGPLHRVKIAAFAIGRTEVTFEQYDRFAKATRRKLPEHGDNLLGLPEESFRGDYPVINVSWQDAVAYTLWLSEETRAHYRLPTEAEWEYAARAGTRTAFSTGDCIDTNQANYNVNRTEYSDCGAHKLNNLKITITEPVGSLPANPWGLHEVHGNVSEWVQDCWHGNYNGAPRDGSAWVHRCKFRVVRGGSWFEAPVDLRSSARSTLSPPDGAVPWIGFRLARTL